MLFMLVVCVCVSCIFLVNFVCDYIDNSYVFAGVYKFHVKIFMVKGVICCFVLVQVYIFNECDVVFLCCLF